MLNAFRHQRFDTFVCSISKHHPSECSTPFGIRDSTRFRRKTNYRSCQVLNAFRHQRFDTIFGDGCVAKPSVLNAFRHQRFDTFPSTPQALKLSSCSTPFGIRDSTREGGNRYRLRGRMCSTPFGIRDSTLLRGSNWLIRPYMCSTPFGIRDSTRITPPRC